MKKHQRPIENAKAAHFLSSDQKTCHCTFYELAPGYNTAICKREEMLYFATDSELAS